MKMSVQTLIRRSLIPVAILVTGLAITAPALLAAHSAPAKKTPTTVPASQLIDVNHATVGELMTLPGIQDAFAAKIVKNRPYANKTQLSSQGVIPAATYRKIRTLIIAKQ
jgi:competence protein ComEA